MAEPISITDNGDGTHTVTYTPANDGPYTVCVKYADQEVPRRSVPKRFAHRRVTIFYWFRSDLSNCLLSVLLRSRRYRLTMPVKFEPAVQVSMHPEFQPVCRLSSPSMPETPERDCSRFRYWLVPDSHPDLDKVPQGCT